MVDTKTTFRLDQLEGRTKTLGDRLHDIGNTVLDNKTRLDNDVQAGKDREIRLRAVEVFIEQQKGKAMQNKAILGIIGLLAGLAGELLGKVL